LSGDIGADTNFTVAIKVDFANNDTASDIVRLVVDALDAKESDVIFIDSDDGTLFLSVRVPFDSALDAETIEKRIGERLAEEYGEENVLEVSVEQKEP